MRPTTEDRLDELADVLGELRRAQERADALTLEIADSRDHGSQSALCRLFGIKPQSLEDRLNAARNRLAARSADAPSTWRLRRPAG